MPGGLFSEQISLVWRRLRRDVKLQRSLPGRCISSQQTRVVEKPSTCVLAATDGCGWSSVVAACFDLFSLLYFHFISAFMTSLIVSGLTLFHFCFLSALAASSCFESDCHIIIEDVRGRSGRFMEYLVSARGSRF